MGRKIKPNEYIRWAIMTLFLMGSVNIMTFGLNLNGFIIVLLSAICWVTNEKVG